MTTTDPARLLPGSEEWVPPVGVEAQELRVVELKATGEAASAARRLVRRELTGWGLEDLVDDVALVVSELTANAVLYGGRPGESDRRVAVTVTRYSDMFSVGVEDHNRTQPVLRAPGPDATGGRGLHLVTEYSDHWTTVELEDGKRVIAYWRTDETAQCRSETAEPALAT